MPVLVVLQGVLLSCPLRSQRKANLLPRDFLTQSHEAALLPSQSGTNDARALTAFPPMQIQQAIYGDLQNHTVLVIAHRLSTVEKAHNIIVLDKGRVVQQGSHKELMEEGGLYSKLVQRQILGLETGGHQPEARGDSAKAPSGLEEEFRIDHSLPATAQDDYNNTAHK